MVRRNGRVEVEGVAVMGGVGRGSDPTKKNPDKKKEAKVSAVQLRSAFHRSKYSQMSVNQWVDKMMQQLPVGFLDKSRCVACLRSGHDWAEGFAHCGRGCPFCGVPWENADGHLAAFCGRRPQTRRHLCWKLDKPGGA